MIPTVTFKTYPNQKTRIDGSLVGKVKERDAANKHSEVTGGNSMVKQYNYDLRRSIYIAKHKYRHKVEEQFNGSDRGLCGRGS